MITDTSCFKMSSDIKLEFKNNINLSQWKTCLGFKDDVKLFFFYLSWFVTFHINIIDYRPFYNRLYGKSSFVICKELLVKGLISYNLFDVYNLKLISLYFSWTCKCVQCKIRFSTESLQTRSVCLKNKKVFIFKKQKSLVSFDFENFK